MIQFKRGKSLNWYKQKKPLEDGQPGYDKDRGKIKIGDGKHSWEDLPDASGLRADEIFDSEKNAKVKAKARAALRPLSTLINALFNKEDRTIITYGPEAPDENTVGQVYLQHYETEPETDYIIEYGTNGIWQYQKYKSGIAKCWGTKSLRTEVQTAIESVNLFHSDTVQEAYPFTFIDVPSETATLCSPSGVAWLAGSVAKNDKGNTASYKILSIDQLTSAIYDITFNIEGLWR